MPSIGRLRARLTSARESTARMAAARRAHVVTPGLAAFGATTATGAEGDPVEVHLATRSSVPPGYRAASEYSWRFLVMVGAVAVVGWAAMKVSLVVIAALVAVLVTALLSPLNQALRRAGLSNAGAAATAFLGGIAFLVALGWFITAQLVAGFADLQSAVVDAVNDLTDWLDRGPLNVGLDIDRLRQQALDLAEANRQEITTQALSIASAIGHFFAGLALTLFTTFFLLYDGRRVWTWVLRLLPRYVREDADAAALHGWATLVGYVRGTCIVAAVDAVFIGIGLVLLDVPLAVPLAILVFLGAFVPLVGATVTGVLAALVALATNGLATALITIAIILAVQQIEGHILQPFLLGRLVNVHPLGIVLAVAAGSLVAGIAGAVFAVPLVAVVNSVGTTLAARAEARRRPRTETPIAPSPEEAASGQEGAAAPSVRDADSGVLVPGSSAEAGSGPAAASPAADSSTVPPIRQ
jgi:predicted PurR-regulated permease PerM